MNHQVILKEICHEVLPLLGEGKVWNVSTPMGMARKMMGQMGKGGPGPMAMMQKMMGQMVNNDRHSSMAARVLLARS